MDIAQCIESSSSEEEDIGMRKCRIKINVEIKMRKRKEKVVKWKRLKYLVVAEQVTMIL